MCTTEVNMRGECKFLQNCALFGNSVVCNQMGGYAYGHKAGGCYRDLLKNRQKSIYWKESRVTAPDKQLAVKPALQS